MRRELEEEDVTMEGKRECEGNKEERRRMERRLGWGIRMG